MGDDLEFQFDGRDKGRMYHLIEKLCTYQCKPRGGGGRGVRARGGDLTNIDILGSNSPGWETKGRSKLKKSPHRRKKKSKQTIL